jgi:hypothetical protein
MEKVTNIFFLSSNPKNAPELGVIQESEIIIQALERGRYRDNLNFYDRHLGTFAKLQQTLLDKQFHIVHISGHGTGDGMVLQREDDSAHIIPSKTLMEEFNAYTPPIQCVILNACYSADQLTNLSCRVPFMIVMEGRINDSASIQFARGFYDAVAAGKSIRTAYEVGKRAADAEQPKNFLPHLIEMVDPNKLPFDLLNAASPEVRIDTARWLGATQGDRAISEIVRHLDAEPHPEVRYWSILALGQIGTAEADRALEQFVIRDPNDRFAIRDSKNLTQA